MTIEEGKESHLFCEQFYKNGNDRDQRSQPVIPLKVRLHPNRQEYKLFFAQQKAWCTMSRLNQYSFWCYTIIISKVVWLALSQLYRENSEATLKLNNFSSSQFHFNSSYERRGPRPRRWWVHVVIISWLSKFMLWLW